MTDTDNNIQTEPSNSEPTQTTEVDLKKQKRLESLAKARQTKAEKSKQKKQEKLDELNKTLTATPKPVKKIQQNQKLDKDSDSEEDDTVIYYQPPPENSEKKQQKEAKNKMINEMYQWMSEMRLAKEKKSKSVSVVKQKKPKENQVATYYKDQVNKTPLVNMLWNGI